jgi:hypothetical protein
MTALSQAEYDDHLFEVVYRSLSLTDAAGEKAIVDTSRLNNAKRDISGCLICSDGNFLQILEGPRANVLSLINTIEKDTRHSGFVIMRMSFMKERSFKDWTMANFQADERTFMQLIAKYAESDNSTEKMIYQFLAFGTKL